MASATGALVVAGTLAVPLARAQAQESPPTVSSVTVDAQRRLVTTWSAPDTMQYGGHLFLDNDPRDAEPGTGDPRYGSFMYCNNKSTCLGRWDLPLSPGSGPFTFTTESLDCTRFPAGRYYVQLEGYNQDPYPSTRQWEESAVVTLKLAACGAVATTTAAGSTTTGAVGNGSGSQAVSITTAATIVHADGTTEAVTGGAKTVLVDGDVIRSAVVPVKLALKEGRLVLAPHTDLEWLLGAGGGHWQVSGASARYAGEVWLSGQHRMLVAAGGPTVVRMVGKARVVVRSGRGAQPTDTVSVLQGRASVASDPTDTKPVTLTAGFQVFHVKGKRLSAPKRNTSPGDPFWK